MGCDEGCDRHLGAALVGASVVMVVEALVILYVRRRGMVERRERAAAMAQPLAVPL